MKTLQIENTAICVALALLSHGAGLYAQSTHGTRQTPILSQQQAQLLEAEVARNPRYRDSQTLLGKNYAFFILGIAALNEFDMVTAVDTAKAASPFAQHAREQLLSSSVAGVCGEGGEALWNHAFEVQSYQSLHPVPEKVAIKDAKVLGIQAIDRALALEPDIAQWRSYRIPILAFRANHSDPMPLSPVDAYCLLKGDITRLKGDLRRAQLAAAAKLALRAAALNDAKAYAKEMLASADNPKNWNYGNQIFYGNMVLGQLALRRGDRKGATRFLLASGKSHGSPQLNSFGPNMTLAKELLEAGQKEPVLKFFDLCQSFWKMHGDRLHTWSDQVKEGKIPDFGANLAY